MNYKFKYVHIFVLVVSLFIMIWSFGVVKENHTNYRELVDTYGELVQVYEEQSAKMTLGPEAADRIEYLNNDIQRRFQQGHSSSVKPTLGYYFVWFLIGLFGLEIADKLFRKSSADRKLSS